MKKLPDNFGKALDEIQKIFVYKDSMTYDKLNKMFKKINTIFVNNNCEPYDINNVLADYKAETKYKKIVHNLRKFVIKRNSEIFRKIYKSEKLPPFIMQVKKDLDESLKRDNAIKKIQDGLIHVMREYRKNWHGFWSMVNLYENGEIKDINLIDVDDMNKLRSYIK